MTLTAKPPREVSLYLSSMSRPVARIVLMALSRETKWRPSPRRARRAAWIAVTEATAFQAGRHRLHVDGGRPLALQSEQDGLVAAVSRAGQAERAVQGHPYRSHLRQQAVVPQALGEHPGRLHRADRVRARRADAHLEQVEDADRHGCAPLGDSVEDYGAVVVEQHPVLRVPGHRPGQDLRLDVTAGLAQALGRERVVHPDHVLLDDRAFVQVWCNIVRGGAD